MGTTILRCGNGVWYSFGRGWSPPEVVELRGQGLVIVNKDANDILVAPMNGNDTDRFNSCSAQQGGVKKSAFPTDSSRPSSTETLPNSFGGDHPCRVELAGGIAVSGGPRAVHQVPGGGKEKGMKSHGVSGISEAGWKG